MTKNPKHKAKGKRQKAKNTASLRLCERKNTGMIGNLLSIVLLVLLPKLILSQDYLWPTNASEYLSSSFCEYRPGHYHAAIDIKTWNTEGYPCYAVEDGYVKRIRVSPFGYGKVIYIQLKDGNTAIYAHLQKFTDKIDKQVRAIQFKNEKYRLNWWPENMKVKKGEIIAYSGRTGIGVPHLHFEIRNKDDNPVNPQKYYSQIKDHIPPRLIALAVIPLSKETKINGSYLPLSIPVNYIKDDVYVIKKPLYVEGKVGLAIKGYDQADDVHNKYGFYQSTLEINSVKSFQITYDELDYNTTAHINTELYYPWLVSKRERYNKLYLEPYNPLLFYDRSLNSDGSIEIKQEIIPFTISIIDFKNNRSIIRGEIIPAKMKSININEVRKEGKWIYLDFTAPRINDLKFSTRNNKTKWKSADYFEILEGQISLPGNIIKARISLDDSLVSQLKITVNTNIDEILTVGSNNISEDIDYNIHSQGKYLVVESPEIISENSISLFPENVKLKRSLPPGGGTEVLIPAEDITGKPSALMIIGSSGKFWSKDLDYQSLLPETMKTSVWFDSSLVITSYAGSVLDTNLITAELLESDTVLSEFPIASNIFKVLPHNFPIFKALSIRIRADSLPDWGNWGVYKTNGIDRLSYLSSKIDMDKMEFHVKSSSLGKFVIASDTVSPEILIKSPRNGVVYKKTPKIRLDIRDTISGVGNEDDINLLMDGNYVLQEWDPEEDLLTGSVQRDLSKGNHVFTVSVRDRAGNVSREAVYFKIE